VDHPALYLIFYITELKPSLVNGWEKLNRASERSYKYKQEAEGAFEYKLYL
jgi:hypothetical protein